MERGASGGLGRQSADWNLQLYTVLLIQVVRRSHPYKYFGLSANVA